MSRVEPSPRCCWRFSAAEYVCGELHGDARSGFEVHLEHCDECRGNVADFRGALGILRRAGAAVTEPEIPPARQEHAGSLAARVLAEIPPTAWPLPLRRRVAGPLVAALVLIAALSAQFLIPGPRQHEASRELRLARQWLLSAQEPDGSWSPERWGGNPSYRVALTGLAVLALLGGEEEAADKAVRQGVDFLLRRQRSDGGLGGPSSSAIYSQAIGTLALLEAGRTSAPVAGTGRVAGPGRAADQALTFLVQALTDSGARGFAVGLQADSIDSTSIWALQAMTPAPGGRASSRTLHDRLARFAAQRREGALSFHDAYLLLKGLKLCRLPILDDAGRTVRESLMAQQIQDGPLRGSWNPTDRWSPAGGRVYTTALAALALKEG